MKTDELTGSRLDYWVAEAEGLEPKRLSWTMPPREFPWHSGKASASWLLDTQPSFSSRWDFAGPIIERERIMLAWNNGHWIAGVTAFAETRHGRIAKGSTALEAAMRAYVLSRFGETVAER